MPTMRSSSRMSRLPSRRIRQPRRMRFSRSLQRSVPSRGGSASSIGFSHGGKALHQRREAARRRRVSSRLDWSLDTARAGDRRAAARRRPARVRPSGAIAPPSAGRAVSSASSSIRRCRHLVQQVRAGRYAESGRELARDGCSAQAFRRFEHQHGAAGARQVGRAGQAIVTAANDDAVIGRTCV